MVKGGASQMLSVVKQMIVVAEELEQAEESGDQAKVQQVKQHLLGLQQQLTEML